MAHEFESGFFSNGQKAWHGLGTVLDDHPETAEEAIKAAGLDWKAEKRPLVARAADGTSVDVPGGFAVMRDSDKSILGVVGNRYTILQNEEAFGFFDPIIENKIGTYETAGSLMGGRRVWILAKLSGDISVGGNDDVVNKFVLLSNTHDGKGSVVAKVTPIRVVCNNTLTAALRVRGGVGDEVKIRHTKTVQDRTKEASKLLKKINDRYDKLAEIWEAMAQFQLPKTGLLDYMQRVLPDPENVDNPKRTQTKRAEMLHLVSDSNLGGALSSAQGTLWGAYNGVTAYADHIQSTRKGATEEKHLENIWFGQKADLKSKALSVAVDFLKEEGVSLSL